MTTVRNQYDRHSSAGHQQFRALQGVLGGVARQRLDQQGRLGDALGDCHVAHDIGFGNGLPAAATQEQMGCYTGLKERDAYLHATAQCGARTSILTYLCAKHDDRGGFMAFPVGSRTPCSGLADGRLLLQFVSPLTEKEYQRMALTFYCGSGSPFAWKVWLALEHKQIPYEFKLMSFDRGDLKTPDFLAINPRGQVPTIVDEGFPLWESNAIVEYLEERFPQRPLLPTEARGRATARRLMLEADNHLYPAQEDLFDATLFRKPGEAEDPAVIAAAQEKSLKELLRWEATLAQDYLAGALSLADFTAYPHVRMVRRIDDRQPKNGLGNRMPPKLAAWMRRIEELPYYAKTIPPHWRS